MPCFEPCEEAIREVAVTRYDYDIAMVTQTNKKLSFGRNKMGVPLE